jgi:hypothetical protein
MGRGHQQQDAMVVLFLAPSLCNIDRRGEHPDQQHRAADLDSQTAGQPAACEHRAKDDCAAARAPRRNTTSCCAAGCHTVPKSST